MHCITATLTVQKTAGVHIWHIRALMLIGWDRLLQSAKVFNEWFVKLEWKKFSTARKQFVEVGDDDYTHDWEGCLLNKTL